MISEAKNLMIEDDRFMKNNINEIKYLYDNYNEFNLENFNYFCYQSTIHTELLSNYTKSGSLNQKQLAFQSKKVAQRTSWMAECFSAACKLLIGLAFDCQTLPKICHN